MIMSYEVSKAIEVKKLSSIEGAKRMVQYLKATATNINSVYEKPSWSKSYAFWEICRRAMHEGTKTVKIIGANSHEFTTAYILKGSFDETILVVDTKAKTIIYC